MFKSVYVGYVLYCVRYIPALIKHTFSFSFLKRIIQAIRVTNSVYTHKEECGFISKAK
jgi:hypothetical protein